EGAHGEAALYQRVPLRLAVRSDANLILAEVRWTEFRGPRGRPCRDADRWRAEREVSRRHMAAPYIDQRRVLVEDAAYSDLSLLVDRDLGVAGRLVDLQPNGRVVLLRHGHPRALRSFPRLLLFYRVGRRANHRVGDDE